MRTEWKKNVETCTGHRDKQSSREAACAEAGINMHIKNEDRGHCGWRKWEEAGGALERGGAL